MSLESIENIILHDLKEAEMLLKTFSSDQSNLKNIEHAADILVKTLKNKKTIFSCGNGGSHCDAMHFAEELTGRYRENRPAYAAIAISDPSYLSCVANDYGYENVFSRFVEGVGHPGDCLVALTTSGNSENICKAIAVAQDKGLSVIVLTGNDGGKVAGKAHVEINVPHCGFADRIQEIHIKIIHILIRLIEVKMQ